MRALKVRSRCGLLFVFVCVCVCLFCFVFVCLFVCLFDCLSFFLGGGGGRGGVATVHHCQSTLTGFPCSSRVAAWRLSVVNLLCELSC